MFVESGLGLKMLLAACIHPTSDIIGYVKALLFPWTAEKRKYIYSRGL